MSTLQVYEEGDFREMVRHFGADYRWEFGRIGTPWVARGYFFWGAPT
ncbi:MAG: hypothetical protein IPI67_19640 [Myxococcales bacterium]|nr:hypothetical protein [Myxococcales bacterium]